MSVEDVMIGAGFPGRKAYSGSPLINKQCRAHTVDCSKSVVLRSACVICILARCLEFRE
jgi:hypothetical protein